MLENAKLASRWDGRNKFDGRGTLPVKLAWHGLACNELPQLVVTHLAEPAQVRNLFFQIVVGTVKPVAPVCTTMNSEWPADRVAIFPLSKLIVLREDFDSFSQASALDSHSEVQRQVVNVNSALPSQGRPLHENPEMPAPFAHLQGRLHPVLLKGILQLEQV